MTELPAPRNLAWALQACQCGSSLLPHQGAPGKRSISTLMWPRPQPPSTPGPRAGRPAVNGSRPEACTHHGAESDGGMPVGLHMLLAEGLHHVGVRLQEELRELLANEVMAAVAQEPARSVVGHQDLQSQRGGPASAAAPRPPEQPSGRRCRPRSPPRCRNSQQSHRSPPTPEKQKQLPAVQQGDWQHAGFPHQDGRRGGDQPHAQPPNSLSSVHTNTIPPTHLL